MTTSLSTPRHQLLEHLLKAKGIQVSLPKIPRRANVSPAPLALNQEGLWFIEQLDPGNAYYNIPGAVRLRGQLNFAALEQSLQQIVQRHETLRTIFVLQADGSPGQMVTPSDLHLPMVDLQELPPAQRESEAKRLATEEAHRAFDLARGPLFRVLLLRLAAEEHVMILNVHHLVADGWSLSIFTRELKAFYEAFSTGRPAAGMALPIQYADFAIWQREQMAEKGFQAQLAYWRQQLGGALPVLQLPTDYPHPKKPSFRGGHQTIEFSKPLTEALRKLARREEVTSYIVLIAAFKVLLHHYTGQDEIVVGSTFANRNYRELQQLIGFFVNTLPLRSKLSTTRSFRELLGHVRQVALDASAHQELPLAKLVQELRPERDLGRNPFYQVVFDLLTPDHNPAVYGYGLLTGPVETLAFSGLTITPFDFEYSVSRFDLAMFIWDLPEALAGVCEYCVDLFLPATIARFVKDFEVLLKQLIANPEARLGELSAGLRLEEQQQQMAKTKEYKAAVLQKLKQTKRQPVIPEP